MIPNSRKKNSLRVEWTIRRCHQFFSRFRYNSLFHAVLKYLGTTIHEKLFSENEIVPTTRCLRITSAVIPRVGPPRGNET